MTHRRSHRLKLATPASRASPLWGAISLAALLLALAGCTNGPLGGPALAQPEDQRTTLGEPVTVQLTIVSEAPSTVSVTATSSNEQVLPLSGIVVTGTGADRSLVITPSHSQTGTSIVSVEVQDDRGAASRDFDVQVTVPFAEHVVLETESAEPIGVSLAIQGEVLVAGGLKNAFVFELQGDQWEQKQRLAPLPNGISDVDGYGDAVALDGSRILIGADETTNTHTSQGAAFLYEVDGGTYDFVTDFLDNDPAQDELLGRSVAVLDDHLFAGVPGGSTNDVQSGTVNVYQPDGFGAWTLLGKLAPSDATTGTVFGDALDVSDGLAVIGDYANEERGAEAGAAYVFAPDGDFWSEVIKLAPPALEDGDQFGLKVAGDGEWIFVSAWNDDTQAENAGAVYVFHLGGSGWVQADVLYASDAAQNGGFASSVELEYPYAVVGAHLEDSQGNNAGAVYVFRHDGATWHQVAKLTSPEPAAEAGFGWDVAISGEYLVASQLSPPLTVVYRR